MNLRSPMAVLEQRVKREERRLAKLNLAQLQLAAEQGTLDGDQMLYLYSWRALFKALATILVLIFGTLVIAYNLSHAFQSYEYSHCVQTAVRANVTADCNKGTVSGK